MDVYAHRACHGPFLFGATFVALLSLGGAAAAQVQLPEVVVSGAKPKAKPRPAPHRATAAPVTPAAQLNAKANAFDQSRSNLYTTIGTTSDTISHDTLDI